MTAYTTPPDPADLSRDLDAEGESLARWNAALAPFARAGDPDPAWVSALRGRLLAVLSAGASAWLSGQALWTAWEHIRSEGFTAEHAAALLTQSSISLDAWTTLAVAAASLLAMLGAGASWLRARRARG
jgi:hypothetical protein